MTPRLAAVAAVAAVALLVAGCGTGGDPTAEVPPPAAELVRLAQERIRLAGTGHLTVHEVALDNDAQVIMIWTGDYDLLRHLWSVRAELEAGTERGKADLVGAADHVFSSSPSYPARYRGKWVLGPTLDDENTEPHLAAVLAFEPGDVTKRDGDGWSVPGRLPMSTVLRLLDLNGRTPDEQRRLADAEGSAAVRLVLGPDREVRELRITGSELDLTGLNLSDDVDDVMRDMAMSIQVGDLGGDVTITEPPADRVVDPEAGA